MIQDAIKELIDSTVSNRVYALTAPQSVTFPYVTFSRESIDVWRSINAPSAKVQETYDIDVFGKEYYETQTVADNIVNILDGYRGTVAYGTDSPQESIKILGISLQDSDDNIIEIDEPLVYNVNLNFLITYERN